MGKKRKNKDRIDATLPPEQKIQKLVELSEKKQLDRDWNGAEKMARQAVAEARDHLYRNENDILHAKSNLQLGLVNLARGHFAQARKPIEIAQKIAEASSSPSASFSHLGFRCPTRIARRKQ